MLYPGGYARRYRLVQPFPVSLARENLFFISHVDNVGLPLHQAF